MLAETYRKTVRTRQHRFPPHDPARNAPVAAVVRGQRLEVFLGALAIPRIVETRHVVNAFERDGEAVAIHEPAPMVFVFHPRGHVVADGVLRCHVEYGKHAVRRADFKQPVDFGEVEFALCLFYAAPFAESVQARVSELLHLRDVRRPLRRVRRLGAAERREHAAHDHLVVSYADAICRRESGECQHHGGESPRYVCATVHARVPFWSSRSCASAT